MAIYNRKCTDFFFYLQKEKKLEDIIFLVELEQDFNFLDQASLDLLHEFTNVEQRKKLKFFISNEDKITILTNFKKHALSNWKFEIILFSCGVICCLHEFKSLNEPDVHFFYAIYDFLLGNTLTIQFYFFIKKNTILLKYKRKAISTMIIYLDWSKFINKINLSLFLENFILIWDLLQYPEHEFLQLQKQIKDKRDIKIIELNLEEK